MIACHPWTTGSDRPQGQVAAGGMYEVQLGKLAEKKGTTQDVKDQGNTETHDDMLVGDKLESIAATNGLAFPDKLDAEFQPRFDRMSAMSSGTFDAADIADMKKIHDAEGAAFAKEAKSGTNPDLKAFAAETHRIVERHLGELSAKVHRSVDDPFHAAFRQRAGGMRRPRDLETKPEQPREDPSITLGRGRTRTLKGASTRRFRCSPSAPSRSISASTRPRR